MFVSVERDQVSYGLPTADVRGTVLGDQCPVEVDFPCQPRKYRAFNGYCNNVQNPRWGNGRTMAMALPFLARLCLVISCHQHVPSAWPCTVTTTRHTSS